MVTGVVCLVKRKETYIIQGNFKDPPQSLKNQVEKVWNCDNSFVIGFNTFCERLVSL